MAKVGLTKLGLTKNTDIEVVEWNEQKIEVKQYLPIEEKLNLITRIINLSVDDNGYYNPAKVYIYTILEILYAYTNINFTEKQKEDVAKTYDLVAGSGLSAKIFGALNPYEYQQLQGWIHELIDSIYEYRNSAYGILDTVKTDYADVDLDAQKIIETLDKNPEDLAFLKEVVDKLG